MVQLDELRLKLAAQKPGIDDLAASLGLDAIGRQIKEMEAQSAEPTFWDDMESSQKVLQKMQQLKAKVQKYEVLVSAYEDAMTMIEIANEEEDESFVPEIEESVEKIMEHYEEQRLSTLLTGPYDEKNCHPYLSRRSRRHGSARLGEHVVPHVCPLG